MPVCGHIAHLEQKGNMRAARTVAEATTRPSFSADFAEIVAINLRISDL